MLLQHFNILLADDDADDCLLFNEALEELPLSAALRVVNNGEQLMQLLLKNDELPHVLFLDLNMPRKNGFECLAEIKFHPELNRLPVIIFSTSLEQNTVNRAYKKGAQYYIQKPAEFCQLKNVIHQALMLSSQEYSSQPSLENFVLKGDIPILS